MLIKEKNQSILIKTYTFESGLWYLAKSLGDYLINKGHSVVYIPKSKYLLEDRLYKRHYLNPKNPKDFKNNIIEVYDNKKEIPKQVISSIVKYKADYILSFETFMLKSNWVYNVKKKKNIKIIDIPMVEWVTPNLLKNKSYNIFDEVWVLNDLALNLFVNEKYKNVRKVNWDFVDSNLFYSKDRERRDDLVFYHQASLNSEYSSKNTEKVLAAFDLFLKKYNNVSLILTGNIKDKNSRKIIEKHTNIKHINEALSREEVANIYRYVDCIVAPSSREGLGLFLFEAAACGCSVITTNTPPMNEYNNKYLCQVSGYRRDKSLIPRAIVNPKDILKQLNNFYEDITNEQKSRS